MATIHIQCIGDKALLSQSDLDRLVELAQRSEAMTALRQEADVPTLDIMRLMEQRGAGDVVLTRFPFTDLTGASLRPAVVVS